MIVRYLDPYGQSKVLDYTVPHLVFFLKIADI